jgi:SWI/SNF-related matrix-associated actin-dependent regulator of chromatin subfamily A3
MLKAMKYHGPHRHISAQSFVEADIVITTYHTLASDLSGAKGSLKKLKWYRLVLDEGLFIMEQHQALLTTVLQLIL